MAQRSSKKNGCTRAALLSVLDDLLCALQYMHETHQLVHMDIKPENILVASDGGFRLADFGLAKPIKGSTDSPVFGTYDYQHPNLHGVRVLRHDELRFEYDCYSVGRVLELDLLPHFKSAFSAEDATFLELMTKRATSVKDEGYRDVRAFLRDLDKLRNQYSPSTSVQEFATREPSVPTVRIPSDFSVTTTTRVLDVMRNPWFRRLATIRQLGPICLVYPGAHHTRLEHSLGCYHYARRYLESLLKQSRFRNSIDGDEDVVAVLVAALLHDIGHYPFSHAVEEAHRRFAYHDHEFPDLDHEASCIECPYRRRASVAGPEEVRREALVARPSTGARLGSVC